MSAPLSNGRLAIALGGLAVLGLLAWRTMEPGKAQQLTWLLLGFFAFRIVLSAWRSRKIDENRRASSSAGFDV